VISNGAQIDALARDGALGGGSVGDFVALLKPKVITLVVVTAIGGLVAAPQAMNPVLAAIAILAIAVGGGAAGALNMWYDADIDAVMGRTVKRPIPTGRIARDEALAFGLILTLFSVLVLGLATNAVAAGLLAFTIFFYAVVYTMWLKRSTAQNIVIGGAAGAFPPMIGWAAATGDVGIESLMLFLVIFMWTPPHFWALALAKHKEYGAAAVPMMPVTHGADHTRLNILIYSILLAPLGLLPTFMGFAGALTLLVGLLGGAAMVFWAFNIFRRREGAAATRACWAMFGGSIFYLYAFFIALIADHALAAAGLLPLSTGGGLIA
jgi:protoheme IX farnesyltransferase